MSIVHEAGRRAQMSGQPAEKEPGQDSRAWSWRDTAATLLILTAVAALFFSAPRSGEFWWSDAPRHALNGVFIRDLVTEMPFDAPRQWAVDYYFHSPALTVLFYPPLFPAVEAVVFAVGGVSPGTAQFTVALFLFLAGLAAYLIARNWFDRAVAAGCALIFLGLPEVALWGRQVMLEIPLAAMMLASLAAFLSYLRTGRQSTLAATAALMVLTLYTKQTALFLLPVMAVTLVAVKGPRALLSRSVALLALVCGIALVPLAWMTLEFGATNVQSVAGVSDAAVSRASLSNWTWYLRHVPAQVGWPLALLATAWAALAAFNRSWRLPRAGQLLLLGWFLSGYAFFSVISLKEQRFTLVILFPVVVAAVALIEGLAPRRLAGAAVIGTGLAVLAHAVILQPVPAVDGYREAAGWIADHAEDDAVVLFSGSRDGSFIFNLRSFEERRDVAVVRADKLLLKLAVRRTLGVEELPVSREELIDRLDRLGIRYVVADPEFWTDLENMAMLSELLESDRFERLASIPVRANVAPAEREVRIYRNLGPVSDDPEPFTMRLEMIDETISSSGR